MAVVGQGKNCYVLNEAVSDTLPHRSTPTHLAHSRSASYQLVTEGVRRSFHSNSDGATDGVVASTHTWTLTNAVVVSGDVGGLLIVYGSAHNDGVYSIASRTSATVLVTGQTQTNETFAAGVKFTIVPPGTLAGAWIIEVSNDFSPEGGGENGQPPSAHTETWTDITAAFDSPAAIAAVVAATASTRNQFVQAAPLAARCIRATFTATSGAGVAKVIVAGGSY